MYLAMILFSLYKKYQSAVKRKTKHKCVRGTLEERTMYPLEQSAFGVPCFLPLHRPYVCRHLP